MKSGIKKKFLDILFENDDDYIDNNDKETEVREYKSSTSKEASIDAKEVLYKKSKNSAFINLQETIKNVKEEPKAKNSYEMSSQISPMFGVVNEKRKKANIKKDVDEIPINKTEVSRLDIITSPIYGYGEQDEEHYLPSQNQSFDNTEDFDETPFDTDTYHDEEFDDLMEYVDNDEEIEYEDHDEHELPEEDYEEVEEEVFDEEENEDDNDDNEEYLGYYKADYHSQEENAEDKDEDNNIPYYDEKIYSDDYDVEEISLFDTEEDE